MTTISNTVLEFSIISINVAVRKIKSDRDMGLSFAGPSGQRVEQQYLDSATQQVIPRADLLKGLWDGDLFRPVSAEDIRTIDEITKLPTLAITEFIPLDEVPWERALATYYLAPQTKARGALDLCNLALIHRALVKSQSAGVLKLTLRTRQHLAVIYPKGDGLYVTTMCWADDWQQAEEANVLSGVPVNEEHLVLLEDLMTDYTSTCAEALDSKTDEGASERAKLIEAALAGKPLNGKGKKAPALNRTLQPNLAEELKKAKAAAIAKKTTTKKKATPA